MNNTTKLTQAIVQDNNIINIIKSITSTISVIQQGQLNSIFGNMPNGGIFLLQGNISSFLFSDQKNLLNIANEFLVDSNLRKFFPGISDQPINDINGLFNTQSNIITNMGGGGSQQLPSLIISIISVSVITSVINEKAIIPAKIIEEIPRTIEKLRKFASGEEVSMPIIVGLSGFDIDDGLEIKFNDNAVLRKLSDSERILLLGSTDQSIQAAIFANVNQKILLNDPSWDNIQNNMDKLFKSGKFNDAANSLNKNISDIKMSILLSLSTKSNYLSISESGIFSGTLMQNGGQVYRESHNGRFRDLRIRLEANKMTDIKDKYNAILKLNTDSIDIAKRRIFSAVGERDNIDDAFIDSIICWENIIASERELTFTVCASVAKLLGKTQSETDKIYTELKDIYNERSRLVHGSTRLKQDKLYEYSKKSILFSIRLIDSLMFTYPELLSVKPEDRSKKILMNKIKEFDL